MTIWPTKNIFMLLEVIILFFMIPIKYILLTQLFCRPMVLILSNFVTLFDFMNKFQVILSKSIDDLSKLTIRFSRWRRFHGENFVQSSLHLPSHDTIEYKLTTQNTILIRKSYTLKIIFKKCQLILQNEITIFFTKQIEKKIVQGPITYINFMDYSPRKSNKNSKSYLELESFKKILSKQISGQQFQKTSHEISSNSRKSITKQSLFLDKLDYNRHKVTHRYAEEQKEQFDTRSVRGGGKKLSIRRAQSIDHNNSTQLLYNESLLKLKLEQMFFKFKSRIGAILQQMCLPVVQLNNFSSLGKIDEILDFLSQKVKILIAKTQQTNTQAGRNMLKQQDKLHYYQISVQTLKQKIQEKETTQKNFREKVRHMHTELREVFDKLTRKQKQYSLKVTELYQEKTTVTQLQQVITSLKEQNIILTKQCQSIRQSMISQNKVTMNYYHNIQQQNAQLKQYNEQLKQQIQRLQQRQVQREELNSHLNEEVERWRQRFETQRGTHTSQSIENTQKQIVSEYLIDSKQSNSTQNGKFNSLSILNENTRLALKISQLEAQNKSLIRDNLGNAFLRERYNELLGCMENPNQQQTIKAINPSDIKKNTIFQLEYEHRKMMESIAKEWRQKLIEVVNLYQEQIESSKSNISILIKDKIDLEEKVYKLANEKYIAQTKLIQKERELYEYQRIKKTKQSQIVTNSLEEEENQQLKDGEDKSNQYLLCK